MAKRNYNPWPLERKLGVLECKVPQGGIRERAAFHQQRRCEIVANILCHAHQLSVHGRFRRRAAAVSGRGAKVQFFRGRRGETEGAHCAPRQLLIDEKPMQEHVSELCVLHALIERLFAEVDVLPVAFNSVDSDSEKAGLDEAFIRTAANTVALPVYSPVSLDTCYQLFASEANHIYQRISKEVEREIQDINRQLDLHSQATKITSTAIHRAFDRQRGEWKQERDVLLDKLEIARAYADTVSGFQPQSLTASYLDFTKARYLEHRPDGRGGCTSADCLRAKP